MDTNEMTLDQSLNKIVEVYQTIDEVIDEFVEDKKAEKALKSLKKHILEDEQLKDLIERIKTQRPFRCLIVGDNNESKRNLVNAMAQHYVISVNDVEPSYEGTKRYYWEDGKKTLAKFLDTQGAGNQEEIIEQVNAFFPDVALVVIDENSKDLAVTQIQLLKEIANAYEAKYHARLPIVVVLNKYAGVAVIKGKGYKTFCKDFSNKMADKVEEYKELFINNGLVVDEVMPVSSVVQWMNTDNTVVMEEALKLLTKNEEATLHIGFDGRYQIQELVKAIENLILSDNGKTGFKLAFNEKETMKELANHFKKVFAEIGGNFWTKDSKQSDIYTIFIIQALQVMFIAMLGKKNVSVTNSMKFLCKLYGVGGELFEKGGVVAQAALGALVGAALKKLPLPVKDKKPGKLGKLGAALPALVAPYVGKIIINVGTAAVGKAAILYYIDNKNLNVVVAGFKDVQQEIKNRVEEKISKHDDQNIDKAEEKERKKRIKEDEKIEKEDEKRRKKLAKDKEREAKKLDKDDAKMVKKLKGSKNQAK